MNDDAIEIEGGCTCRHVRSRVTRTPLVVHCCHCRWCQRETGSAFVLNALVEAEHVGRLEGEVDLVQTPSARGNGQAIARCPECRVAVWSNYRGGGAGPRIRFVRVGTLDDPTVVAPDVHIYTASKQPWVVLPATVPAFEGYYRASEVWSAASLARREALRAGGRS